MKATRDSSSPTGTSSWDKELPRSSGYSPLLERGTANVIYSDAGVGKSLVALEAAAGIAQTEHVIYVDSENRRRDHRDRLASMGYVPAKLRKLHMVSYPELPPLDSAAGGRFLLREARDVNASLVVIDTTMRFVAGRENDADTFNAFYNCTMKALKGAGICSLRLDHEGKDGTRGQRGSSAKRGDVDSVWRLTHKGANRWLENEKDRSRHYPDKIRLELTFSPFAHDYHWDHSYLEPAPAVSNESAGLIAELDRLGIPPEWGRERVTRALHDKGLTFRNNDLAEALRVRKG